MHLIGIENYVALLSQLASTAYASSSAKDMFKAHEAKSI
jgi:hypothetical protein